jgi:hypothetical protein
MGTDDDGTSGTTKTLTQADIDRAFAAGASREREKLNAKYADYDELKAKAADADKSKSQLDRIEEKLAATEKRAAEAERLGLIREVADELGISMRLAERLGLIREVADELGISMRLAKRLEGATKAELLADGRDTMEDLGIKPKGKASSSSAKEGEATDGDDGTEDDAATDDAATSRETPTRSARPRETLRSGAPRTDTKPEETNPLKLVEGIPRR